MRKPLSARRTHLVVWALIAFASLAAGCGSGTATSDSPSSLVRHETEQHREALDPLAEERIGREGVDRPPRAFRSKERRS